MTFLVLMQWMDVVVEVEVEVEVEFEWSATQ